MVELRQAPLADQQRLMGGTLKLDVVSDPAADLDARAESVERVLSLLAS